MTAVDIDADDPRRGLLALVVALVEIIHELLKRQAARRLERGTLTWEELDRVGRSLEAIEAVLREFKDERDLHDAVSRVHGALDSAVAGLVLPEYEEVGSGGDAGVRT